MNEKTEINISHQILEQVLEYCKEHGHRPPKGSLLDDWFAAIYKSGIWRSMPHEYYSANEEEKQKFHDTPEYKNYRLVYEIRSFPTEELKKVRDAGRVISIRKAAKNAVGVERVFPRAKLVRIIFGEAEYQRISAQNNDMAAKIFAEYFDNVLNATLTERYIEFLELGVGIGVSYTMKSESKKPTVVRQTQSNKMGYFVEGLHPRDIAEKHNLTEARVRQLQNKAITQLQQNQKLKEFFDHYQNGNIDGMLSMLPKHLQQQYKFQQQKNMAQIPTDDINKVGEWLADNMRFQREREM